MIRKNFAPQDTVGGGVYVIGDSNNPTRFFFCTIEDNEAGSGGGLATASGTKVRLEDCVIQYNSITNNDSDLITVDARGGGFFLDVDSDSTFLRCQIVHNTWHIPSSFSVQGFAQGTGGGGFAGGNLTMRNCRIAENELGYGESFDTYGGGLYFGGVNLQLVDCVIENNRIDGKQGCRGGGLVVGDSVYTVGTEPAIINCAFIGNECGLVQDVTPDFTQGGAMLFVGTFTPKLTNVLIAGNSSAGHAGAIADFTGASQIVNCTIANNHAGGEHPFTHTYTPGVTGGIEYWPSLSDASIRNSIIWGNFDGSTNTVDEMQIRGSSTPIALDVKFSCIEDDDDSDTSVPFGAGTPSFNIDDNPDFSGSGLAYFIPSVTSPCIDSGSDFDVPLDAGDVDDDLVTTEQTPWDLGKRTRFASTGMGCTVDMGAYEFVDSNQNGVDDSVDIAACDADPGCADIDIDDNGLIDLYEPIVGIPKKLSFINLLALPDSVSAAATGKASGDWLVTGSAVGDDLGSLNQPGVADFFLQAPDAAYAKAVRKTHPSSEQGDRFGASVAISGKIAAVGAPHKSVEFVDGGDVTVFVLNKKGTDWTAPAPSFTAPTPVTNGQFGRAVAINAQWQLGGISSGCVAVSAVEGAGGADDGVVYIYEYSAIEEEFEYVEALLPDPNITGATNYGRSLSMGSNWLVVGYDLDDNGIAGGVDVFVRANGAWINRQTLVYPGTTSPVSESGFGVSVTVQDVFEDHYLIVGAAEPSGMLGDGKAYIFSYSETAGLWEYYDTVRASDAEPENVRPNTAFGISVDMTNDALLIGASLDGGDETGAAYFYPSHACLDHPLEFKRFSAVPGNYGHFGRVVALGADFAYVVQPISQDPYDFDAVQLFDIQLPNP